MGAILNHPAVTVNSKDGHQQTLKGDDDPFHTFVMARAISLCVARLAHLASLHHRRHRALSIRKFATFQPSHR